LDAAKAALTDALEGISAFRAIHDEMRGG